MKEILFGFVAGIVTSLGMGGGAILILLLSNFTSINQHVVQGTNLVFFIPTSIISILIDIKKGMVNFKYAKIVTFTGIIGAFFGSKLSFKIENDNLNKYFGIFLILIAIFEVFTFIWQYIISKSEK